MKNFSKTALLCASLCLPLAGNLHAMGSKSPSGGGSSNQTTQALIDLGLNVAITYAKTDPKYALILNSLGINSAADVRAFLEGNKNGTNFQNIIARLAMLQAQRDPKVRDFLTQIGITDEASLREFLDNGQGGINYEAILGLALTQAQSNPKYAVWLQRLNINSVQDIKKLIQGGQSGNLQQMVMAIALNYVQSQPKYQKYAPYIQLAATLLGVSIPSTGTGLDLGAFNGMVASETKAIQTLN